MEARAALLDGGPIVRAEAFESIALRALGTTADGAPVERWAQAYAAISEELQTAPWGGPSAFLAPRGTAERDRDAVWALVYGARTFQIASHLFSNIALPSPMVDVGAGWGSAALAAALRAPGAAVTLIDASAARLADARALFHAAGLGEPTTSTAHAESLTAPAGGSLVIAYALNELLGRRDDTTAIARGAALLARWTRELGDGGRLCVLEPGTRNDARRLQKIRDALPREAHILGPCTGALRCPRLEDERNWCHFTWRFGLGPLGRRIAAIASRVASEAHVSWLMLTADSVELNPKLGRVLETRELGRPKRALHLCTPRGEEVLTVLRRNRGAFDQAEHLAGALVRVDAAKMTDRGPERRFEGEALEVVAPV